MNRITELFNIKYPIVQGGMIWCSGWELAAAVSNAGGLGLLGSGSMNPDVLAQHIDKCKNATDKPFGVNIPLMFKYADDIIKTVIDKGVKIVFTSAGSPSKYTQLLKQHGIKVVHVIANLKFALKCAEAGVDAIVAEGFEAGGHNGIEENTTMVLIRLIRENINLPLIAAGGIADGFAMHAAFALGAEGVQIGSRFVASTESSAHQNFKQAVINAKDGETFLMLKKIAPVRLLKNNFFLKVKESENQNANLDQLNELLGKGRSKLGMFEGNIDDGELEIGQAAALINKIKPASEIVEQIIKEFNQSIENTKNLKF